MPDGGLLYGTTYSGGPDHCGTIYSFDPSGVAESVVYDFTCGADGGYPFATLTLDGSALYGVTSFGGSGSSCGGSGRGAIYAFDPSLGMATSLYAFGNGSNGGNPEAEVTIIDGNIFGTTFDAGRKNEGTLFALPE